MILASTTGGGATVARFLGQPGEGAPILASPSTSPDNALEPAIEIPASALDQANGARQFSLSSVLLSAYQAAVAGAPSTCNLSVPLLAAIGQVESGSLVGRSLDSGHRLTEPVLGPVLDGNGFAAIADTDNGTLDGDTTWDRAMGPMQFIPSTWRTFGVDADADGATDPQDVDDATASAAAYLCADGRDLSTEEGVRAAVLSYNNSQAYYFLVLRWKAAFENASSLVVEDPDTGSESVSAGAVIASPVAPASLGFGSDSPASVAPAPKKSAASPTAQGTPSPTAPAFPGQSPTATPTPGATPGVTPSGGATGRPTGGPTGDPTVDPTGDPTGDPTVDPTVDPTDGRSETPSKNETPDETPDEDECALPEEDLDPEGTDPEPGTEQVAPPVTEGLEDSDEQALDPEDPCAELDPEELAGSTQEQQTP
jgi:hypothetical protein